MKKLAGLCLLAVVFTLSGCQKPEENSPSQSVALAGTAWPKSLSIVGDGFPNPGDVCRKIGETAATVNYLDDSATLVGCLTSADAAKLGALGAKVVGEIDGVTLVSVPAPDTSVGGDGDGQGDAKVAGTKYHATAKIRCSGYKGAASGMCEAGVVRDTETGPYVEVTLPDGIQRTIFFNKDGSFLSFAIAESNGTAAMKIESRRDGDTTIATLGTERYEIPDAFVLGD